MKTKIKIFSLTCFFAAASAHAQGTLQINFDGPPTLASGTGVLVTNYLESGISFTPINPNDWNEAFARDSGGTNVPFLPDNGTTYLLAGLGSTLMFSFNNDSLFSLLSVNLGEFSTLYSGQPLTVSFIGYHLDGSTVTTSFTTDGIIDGTGPLADFQTFNFTGFTDLSRVEIPNYGWSLDNLVVSVPEPASNALLALSGLLLGALKLCHRRNRS